MLIEYCDQQKIIDIRQYVKENNLGVKARSKKELCDKIKQKENSLYPKKKSKSPLLALK